MSTIPENMTSVGTSLDLLIPLWIGVGLVALGLVCFLLWVKWPGWVDGWLVAASTIWAFAAIALAILAVSAIPYKPAYWHIYRAHATVEQITNSFDAGTGKITTSPTVILSGFDRPVVIDDPRILQLDGADLTLTCSISWHYQAADTYSCAIYSIDGEATR